MHRNGAATLRGCDTCGRQHPYIPSSADELVIGVTEFIKQISVGMKIRTNAEAFYRYVLLISGRLNSVTWSHMNKYI